MLFYKRKEVDVLKGDLYMILPCYIFRDCDTVNFGATTVDNASIDLFLYSLLMDPDRKEELLERLAHGREIISGFYNRNEGKLKDNDKAFFEQLLFNENTKDIAEEKREE